MVLAVVVLILASILLLKGADLLVESGIRLARIFKVSDFIVGFFILGVLTTSPEIFIGINSSLIQKAEISVGNLMGASLMLMTLIIGLNAIINKEVVLNNHFTAFDILLISLIIIFPGIFMIDGSLSRLDGAILLASYLLFVIIMSLRHTLINNIRQVSSHHHWKKIILGLLLGLFFLIIGSKMAIFAVEIIAVQMKISHLLIGLLLVSFCTNLPEIIVMLTAIKKKHNQVGVGDFLGSAVANTLVLGVIVLFGNISLSQPTRMNFTLIILLLSLLLFNIFIYWRRKLTHFEGIIFVGLYSFFLFSQIFF